VFTENSAAPTGERVGEKIAIFYSNRRQRGQLPYASIHGTKHIKKNPRGGPNAQAPPRGLENRRASSHPPAASHPARAAPRRRGGGPLPPPGRPTGCARGGHSRRAAAVDGPPRVAAAARAAGGGRAGGCRPAGGRAAARPPPACRGRGRVVALARAGAPTAAGRRAQGRGRAAGPQVRRQHRTCVRLGLPAGRAGRPRRRHRTSNGYRMRAKHVFWPWDNL